MNAITDYKVLDVTFRDGGFLNNWDFSEANILEVVGGLDQLGVEIIEIGYLSSVSNLSVAASCPPSFLATVKTKLQSAELAAMLRAYEKGVDELLLSRGDFLDWIRIVVSNREEIPLAIKIAEKVKKAGIRCSLNFANFTVYSFEERLEAVQLATEAKELFDVYCFADSRGAALPEEVFHFITAVQQEWEGLLGFHAHDMLGLAAANSHAALAAGCTIIDGSLKGYGLGAGNTKLIHALALIEDFQKEKKYDYDLLQSLHPLLNLPTLPEQRYLQYLGGQKNLSGLWIAPLLERYGEGTISFLDKLPQKRYKEIAEVWEEVKVMDVSSIYS